ncbi:transporter substrate-binding domain-containing protein [Trueperella bialowiezensis]|uniref:L-cystine-binding protein tcyA n=1 Tax=Trueperella bialowiezensis TaxID=312285 RepID=A0A3S4V7W6_9ACTO|nr:transporter substrate-binding domain-containing protein [Trueperella bialowiezensis]VEI13903.1 L-cystine-binding protein tcyA precursor [Trueperella bialowiezensis]
MSKKSLAAFGALTISLALAACSGGGSNEGTASPEAGNTLLEQARETGKIRVGTEGDYLPYAYHDDNNQLTGIEVEIMELLADDLGLEVDWTPAPWDSLIAGVDADKYDVVIDSLAVTDERKEKFDFSDPYTRAIGKAAVKADSPLQSLSDLDSSVKSAQTPTSNWGKIAADDFGMELVVSEGLVPSLQLVASGRADTTINDIVAFRLYQEQNPDVSLRLLEGEIESPGCCSILVRKGEQEFIDELNAAIEKRIADGSIGEITKKYVGEDLSARQNAK